MELLRTATASQVLYPVAAVVVVLICAALVFVFGFHSAEQPQFDKLPIIVDDRKSANKKRKTKDKKSSPNRTANEEGKAKSESKKSPAKEKKEEKVKEAEKPKPVEPKVVKKESVEPKKGKKAKNVGDAEKPADFDEGLWQEVPKKSEKKKEKVVRTPEEKKEKDSPVKKTLKGKKEGRKEAEVEEARPAPVEEKVKIISVSGPVVDEEADRALQAQIEEVQRILKEAERREQAVLSGLNAAEDEEAAVEELTDVKDLRSNKKKENKEKQKKKETVGAKTAPKPEPSPEKDNSDSSEKQEEATNAPVFDELGDSWTDAKAPKKSKKKVRKDQ
ncbi:unnamed protein product [Plutella xylostella]|uniref:(diamondback moth) hypothetical protein n=1 Tax=Plutella xylostella TaxID=51655 RepID=A0A8S4D298_PLUXY|nr:unnamed protein product [Plutella xylostella]